MYRAIKTNILIKTKSCQISVRAPEHLQWYEFQKTVYKVLPAQKNMFWQKFLNEFTIKEF